VAPVCRPTATIPPTIEAFNAAVDLQTPDYPGEGRL